MPTREVGPGPWRRLAARRQVPGLPVLVLSQYVEQLYARELLADRAGAVGYLLKDRVFTDDQFIDAIRTVAGGGTVMDPEVIAKLLVRRSRDEPIARLSAREREVLELMAEGRSNSAIAQRLFVTDKAVSKHSTSIFGKLGLPPSADDNRRVLAVLAYLNSLSAPGERDEPAVVAVAGEEVEMGAAFHDATAVEHDDLVGVADGG